MCSSGRGNSSAARVTGRGLRRRANCTDTWDRCWPETTHGELENPILLAVAKLLVMAIKFHQIKTKNDWNKWRIFEVYVCISSLWHFHHFRMNLFSWIAHVFGLLNGSNNGQMLSKPQKRVCYHVVQCGKISSPISPHLQSNQRFRDVYGWQVWVQRGQGAKSEMQKNKIAVLKATGT